MKKLISILSVCGCLAVSVFGQTGPRTFDNFDRSQSVNVIKPPAPPIAKASRKVKRKGRWVVVTTDPLVKKTVLSKPVQSVNDGLAAREGMPYASSTKLVMGSSKELKGFTTGNPLVDSYIVDSSLRYGVDPLLIYSQMHQESTFKAMAISPKGASGLMQLMPGTARRFGVDKIYDPKQNIEGGVRYMRFLLDMFNGDVVLALAGYNAGEGAVTKYGWQVPPYRETQEYVRRITDRYSAISDGRYVQTARRVSGSQAAKLEKKAARPLTVYEPDPLAVRLPNGNMMLVNQ
ncbi:MAG: lytic transglycosylase domain-containing protein [Pyrinomonadaceae bacterium]